MPIKHQEHQDDNKPESKRFSLTVRLFVYRSDALCGFATQKHPTGTNPFGRRHYMVYTHSP